jgi:hypothetical protein
MAMRAIMCAAVLVALGGCGRIGGAEPAPPPTVEQPDLSPLLARLVELKAAAVDRSTPQLALQAWWSRGDALDANACDWNRANTEGAKARQLAAERLAVTSEALTGDALARTGEAADNACISRALSREVEQERIDGAQAVISVRIKNVTPIPEGVTLDRFPMQWRDEGGLYRYTLNNVEGEWKIAKIERYHRPSRTWTNFTPAEPFTRVQEYVDTNY